MRELIQKALELRKPSEDEDVQGLVEILGPTFSIPVLEAVVKHYKAIEQEILAKDLLEWMRENDQVEFETEDVKVKIGTYVSASITDEERAFAWLEDNQYSDLIKDMVNFPKGEFTPEIAQALDNLGASYSKKSSIHPQTLKKAISDRLNAGESLPDEDDGFKVNYFDVCQVKTK